MSATERLRELLDERGMEYETEDRPTIRYTEWGDWLFSEPLDAKPHTLGAQCELMRIPATPEQAIAATLGAGTCHPIISDNLTESEGTGDAWADCSECGHLLFVLTDPNSQVPNYCPNCGAKVVDE